MGRKKKETEKKILKDEKSKPRANCLYDFKSESPEVRQSKQKQSVKSRSTRSEQKTGGKSKPSVQRKKKGDKIIKIDQKTETPKGVIQIQTNYQNSDSRCPRGKRHLRGIKPLPPPNLDDISPIVAHHVSQSKSPGRKVKSREKEPSDRRNLRSSPRTVETPSASFLKSSSVKNSNVKDDSGLFLSPRKTMPRFSEGKTSTPACVPKKTSHKVARKEHGRKCVMKVETSTPCEIKPLKSYTKLKQPLTELSPVQRMETPTSDYGSMVSYISPSPTTAKKRKNRASSPAFTLEDDDTESLSLNRSTDKVYKKSKRKYETGRQSTLKLEEWAEKVNSELEDIENFELSVEG